MFVDEWSDAELIDDPKQQIFEQLFENLYFVLWELSVRKQMAYYTKRTTEENVFERTKTSPIFKV